MKKIIFLLFFAALVFSCSKKKDPEPELSVQAAGSYQVNKLKVNGVDIPLTGVVISIELQKFSAEVVSGVMKVKIDGASEPDEDLGTLNLKSTDSGIDVFEGTQKVGNISKANVLTIGVDTGDQNYEIVANKK